MDYQIIELEKKTIVGISTHTVNEDPHAEQIIVALWDKFFKKSIGPSIANTTNQKIISLYSDYDDNHYTVTIGHEVHTPKNQELTTKYIPGGKYAKFTLHGNVQNILVKAWKDIWAMDLDRSFTGDFEEYLNTDFSNADINIYIALKS